LVTGCQLEMLLVLALISPSACWCWTGSYLRHWARTSITGCVNPL